MSAKTTGVNRRTVIKALGSAPVRSAHLIKVMSSLWVLGYPD
jgi:hypothetical protein